MHDTALKQGIVDALGRIDRALEVASPRLRGGTLLLSNHMLRMAARTWGRPFVDNPTAYPGHVMVAVEAFLGAHEDASAVMEWTGRNESNIRQCLSLDTCVVTLGYGVSPASLPQIRALWRTLWASRGSLSEALANMREWELEKGVPALPRDDDGDYPSDEDALSCGNGFPRFLMTAARRT